jgi:flagellar hook-basal body complex protein FliE
VVVPIAPIGAIAPLGAAAPAAATQPPTTSGADFATALGHGLDAVTGAQANADSLAVQAATGQLVDPAQLTIATTQATLMTQLASTLQSKAVTAFNTIMGMQA